VKPDTFDTVEDPSKLNPIFAKPMAVRHPLSSELKIRIHNVEEDKPTPGFKTTYVLKPVPTAFWEGYNASLDPMHTQDTNAMRNHLFNPENPAVVLAMGVSLRSPDPVFAFSPIPQFNVTASNKARVPDGDKSPTWVLAKTEPTQPLFQPIPFVTTPPAPPPPANLPHPDQPNDKQWAAARTSWANAFNSSIVGDGKNPEKENGLLGLCANVLGWNVPSPAQVEDIAAMPKGSLKPWELRGRLPKKLATGRMETGVDGKPVRSGGLEEYYLGLPRFCAAAAAAA
jgi:hypothetical protein